MFFFAGFFPGEVEDHREHGYGHEAPEPATAARQSQAVKEQEWNMGNTPGIDLGLMLYISDLA